MTIIISLLLQCMLLIPFPCHCPPMFAAASLSTTKLSSSYRDPLAFVKVKEKGAYT